MSQDIKSLLPQETDIDWFIDWIKETCQGYCELKQATRVASFGKVKISLIILVASTKRCFYELEVSSVTRCQDRGLILDPEDGVRWNYGKHDLPQALEDYHAICEAVDILISQEGGLE